MGIFCLCVSECVLYVRRDSAAASVIGERHCECAARRTDVVKICSIRNMAAIQMLIKRPTKRENEKREERKQRINVKYEAPDQMPN